MLPSPSGEFLTGVVSVPEAVYTFERLKRSPNRFVGWWIHCLRRDYAIFVIRRIRDDHIETKPLMRPNQIGRVLMFSLPEMNRTRS